jgi:hypothetical protein
MSSRRQFLKSSTAALAGMAMSGPLLAALSKKTKNIGIQLFTIPGMVSADFKGTMEKLAKIGYKEIEFFGPYEFSAAETIRGWSQIAGQLGITENAFYGYKPAEVKVC